MNSLGGVETMVGSCIAMATPTEYMFCIVFGTAFSRWNCGLVFGKYCGMETMDDRWTAVEADNMMIILFGYNIISK